MDGAGVAHAISIHSDPSGFTFFGVSEYLENVYPETLQNTLNT